MSRSGLELAPLKKENEYIYISDGGCVFDLSKVSDKNLKLRIVQIIDLGFSVRKKSSELGMACGVLEKNIDPRLRIFDDLNKFYAPFSPPFLGNATNGASVWVAPDCDYILKRKNTDKNKIISDHEKCRLTSSPLNRLERKLWINLYGGRLFISDDVFAYGALVNIVWHEIHHLTTREHHLTESAPYLMPGDPWPVAIKNIAEAFPEKVRDPVTGEEVSTGKSSWSFLDQEKHLL
ncbi:hypothetical protein [Acetobacter sp.]|uniref:hypothetical protein n=1 Tax=Acetobacter sp. TaxID=440 RepID=UPI0025BEEDAA|nr:hypothetical protein [Acetobacter sp.]MCH4090596.1 hypothetical protein [Acetobacter sp.]MCI1300039.1 hypothetical protein [Acetobacter sp.]MCI1316457.1 hypothetical protein [Acetobacter sp.]